MKLKSKLRVAKRLTTIIRLLVAIIIMSVVFQGCEKDDLFIDCSIEENILQLANKYDLNVSFSQVNGKETTELESFEEL